MPDRDRHRELTAAYKRARPPAGIYLISNPTTGRALLGSSTNLPAVRNRLEFAQQAGMPGALDHRLRRDLGSGDITALALEVLEELEVGPATTDDELASDLATLESLWREKLGPERLLG